MTPSEVTALMDVLANGVFYLRCIAGGIGFWIGLYLWRLASCALTKKELL